MSQHPKFLKNVWPQPILRHYHGKPVQLWRGEVHVSKVFGWAANPRISLEIERWCAKQGGVEVKDITQDQLYALMRDTKEVNLADLRKDIVKNGLREPIVLSFNGTLIDGNRRFFAIQAAVEPLPAKDPLRARLEDIPAFVMMQNATDKEQQLVLVEENFSQSLKEEWPFLVKARIIKEAFDKSTASNDSDKKKEVALTYGWQVSAVTKTLKIWDIITEFKTFVAVGRDEGGLGLTEMEAEQITQEKYHLFNEASTAPGLAQALLNNSSFAEDFYRWMAEGKYRNWQEVRVAYQAWQDSEARDAMIKGGSNAGKDARAIVDYNSRVIREGSNVASKVEAFLKFLQGLKFGQIDEMSLESVGKIEKLLPRILDWIKKARSQRQ